MTHSGGGRTSRGSNVLNYDGKDGQDGLWYSRGHRCRKCLN